MWKQGKSGNPGGRPRGTSNKATAELRELAQRLFDKEYWIQTRELIRKNELHPAIHSRLLEIAAKEHGVDSNQSGITVNLGFITANPEPRQIESSQVLQLEPRVTLEHAMAGSIQTTDQDLDNYIDQPKK